MKRSLFLLFGLTLASSVAACGSSDEDDVVRDSGTPDMGTGPRDSGPDAADGGSKADSPPPGDSGDSGDSGDARPSKDGAAADAEGGAYPAFPVDYPQISKNAGAVMASPVIVTISFPGDTDAPTWEAFGDGIGASSYWSATTSEYGVGPATSGAVDHVRMNQALPPSIGYLTLQKFVTAAIEASESDGGAPDAGGLEGGLPDPVWPKPTFAGGANQTIYSLFIPSTTAVTDPGTGKSFCLEGGLGYHGSVNVNGNKVLYAVTLECGLPTAASEETAAHEYVESATDPTRAGYFGFDAPHLSWDLYTGYNDELADVCQNWQDSYLEETGSFPYWVQTSWSNKIATSGHDPCVPAAAGVYYGMTLFPAEEENVNVDLTAIGGGATNATHGFNVQLGKPITFDVGYFSDGPMAAWPIAYDFPATTNLYTTSFKPLGNGAGTVSIATPSGKNGDKSKVTVTVTAKGPGGFHVMAITWNPSTTGYAPHYLPIVLVDQ